MIEYIQTHIIVTSLIVIASILLLEIIASLFGDKTRIFAVRLSLTMAILAGILVVFAVSFECPNLDLGWRVLISIVTGPFYGCILYGIRYSLICLWIYFSGNLSFNKKTSEIQTKHYICKTNSNNA